MSPIRGDSVVDHRPRFLRESVTEAVCSANENQNTRITHALTPPPITSTALVVPTSDLVLGSLNIMDSTALRASSEVPESRIARRSSFSTFAEWVAMQTKVS